MKKLLTEAPVLAHPNFDKGFVLEPDTSVTGLGAVPSQVQEDKILHPAVYTSRDLPPEEKRYTARDGNTSSGSEPFPCLSIGHVVVAYTHHSAQSKWEAC